MATLTIDELLTLDVVGLPSWSIGGWHGARPLVPFIAAVVRVPASVPTEDLDKTDARILLTLDDGRRVEGVGMFCTGGILSNGDVSRVKYAGGNVVAD